jgi:hypothetical protein
MLAAARQLEVERGALRVDFYIKSTEEYECHSTKRDSYIL